MGGRRSLFRWRVFVTDRSTLSQMSAARAVLSGPDSLSNNSLRTCASTCGHASLAATNNSSSIAIGSPSGSWVPPSSSTHSPYGSGLSLESIGFIRRRAERGQQKPATGLSCRSIVRGITIHTLKNLSYFFPSRCSLVSEERTTELRIRNSSLGWGRVHCDMNVVTRGPPATGVTGNPKRGKSADLIIVAPAIPSFWVCQILSSMTLGSRWNLSNTSLPPLGSLLLQRDMVQDSGKTTQSASFVNYLSPWLTTRKLSSRYCLT